MRYNLFTTARWGWNYTVTVLWSDAETWTARILLRNGTELTVPVNEVTPMSWILPVPKGES